MFCGVCCYKTMMSRSLRASASPTPTERLPAASWADQDETAAELPALPSTLRRACLPDAPDGFSSYPNTLGAPCSERDTENSAPCAVLPVPPAPCGGKTNYNLTRVDRCQPDHFNRYQGLVPVWNTSRRQEISTCMSSEAEDDVDFFYTR